jgi:hypothetical protein
MQRHLALVALDAHVDAALKELEHGRVLGVARVEVAELAGLQERDQLLLLLVGL